MHKTGRMWTPNNSSKDFSIIKEIEVLKRGFPSHAILVKSNLAIWQNATTNTLLLLKEKLSLSSSPCPTRLLISHHAPAYGACNAQALSRKINTYFIHSLLHHHRHRSMQCIHQATWAIVSLMQLVNVEGERVKQTYPEASRLIRNEAEAGFCYPNSWRPPSQAGARESPSSEGLRWEQSNS